MTQLPYATILFVDTLSIYSVKGTDITVFTTMSVRYSLNVFKYASASTYTEYTAYSVVPIKRAHSFRTLNKVREKQVEMALCILLQIPRSYIQ